MALCLAKNGVNARVLDKEDTFHTGSRGFGIQPRTFELMKILGIVDDVQKLATPIPTMQAYKLPGGTVPAKTWDLYEKTGIVWPDSPYANGACLSQSVLESIIRKHLNRYNITVELGQELVGFEQTEDAVSATILDHKTGKTYEIVTDYLVGADGAKGSTRKLLGLTFEGETKDTDGMVWGDVEIKGLGSDVFFFFDRPNCQFYAFRSTGIFGASRVISRNSFQFNVFQNFDHLIRIMARPLRPDGQEFGIGITGLNFDPGDLADEAKAKDFIREHTGRTDLEFGKFSWLSYFRPNMRMVNKFGENRVFVVGDAAHVHSPTGGQGMNTSAQDSSNLGWKLALVLKNLAPRTILSSFNVERLPVVAQMLHATSALYTHVVREVKDEATNKKEDENASGWFRWRNTALEMYGVNYRFSPIVVEERDTTAQDQENMMARAYQGYEGTGTLRAGDRAPEAPGLVHAGTETSLFSLFQPSMHTVLIFPPTDHASLDDIFATTSAYPKSTIQTFAVYKASASVQGTADLVDRQGDAYSSYLVANGKTTIVVVRPDGFIGAIVHDDRGLTRYFNHVFLQSV
ncbi:FAD binding domain-containing protein [Mycena pura]|uniref:FAD binding domain-containing protein n=1 Tax=Mycena pura TaxID=153505 RepID=A0AAD6VCZ5_9AGAR|nr:FAD binding domain-containing protein [Mycena pura]